MKNQSIKAKLNEDVFSNFKKQQYGKKGETVSVTAEFQNVLIVQNAAGNKYPVKRDQLTLIKI